ncbi:hypothetical protein DXG01_008338 [Tephrocybe rancida]|nr:hypothetical protein DXG01_008338 [Tephrocybe rancida]
MDTPAAPFSHRQHDSSHDDIQSQVIEIDNNRVENNSESTSASHGLGGISSNAADSIQGESGWISRFFTLLTGKKRALNIPGDSE